MKKQTKFRKTRWKIWNLVFFSFFILLILFLFLNYYLRNMQRLQRLSLIENYLETELVIKDQKRCQKEEKFTFENVSYIYDCIDEVYLKYGSIETTLPEILKLGYITINDLLSQLTPKEDQEENQKIYSYEKNQKKYEFIVETNEEEIQSVTIHKIS